MNMALLRAWKTEYTKWPERNELKNEDENGPDLTSSQEGNIDE